MLYLSGITARNTPEKRMSIPFLSSNFALDMNNVTFSIGVKRDIVNNIKCPMDGVYFVSTSMVNYGKNKKWITPSVSHNTKQIIRLGMGYFTADYAADDHAFIYCEKGDTVSVRYDYIGMTGGHVTPIATITLMRIAPLGNSLQLCLTNLIFPY